MTVNAPTHDDSTGPPGDSHLSSLQSATVKQRLNQVDRIRAKGVGEHIPLPQLVVCGAQSSGKSSVLEGVTGIPFPRKDGVCTKFATEIILRHKPEAKSITASIIPHGGRDNNTASELRSYQHHLERYDELPGIIEDVSRLMGIRGFVPSGDDADADADADTDAPAFAADVLSIEVIGDTGLHLTVVDLPGLISVDENEGIDVNLISGLVDRYLQSSRTIILAVVQATNDIVIEPIIQRARHFDRSGGRTVGIITKPDLINKGTEGRIAAEINDRDKTRLKLGFFLLKNASPQQLASEITALERKRQEIDFFQSEPWKDLGIDSSRLGVDALQTYLQDLLAKQIEKELPAVCNEIDGLLEKTQMELDDLGRERPTIGDQRIFLSELSMNLLNTIQAALDGTYHNIASDFFTHKDGLSENRLRSRLHDLNSSFTAYMREKSHKRKCVGSHKPTEDTSDGTSSSDVLDEVDSNGEGDGDSNSEGNSNNQFGHLQKVGEPLFLSKSEFDGWIKKVYHDTRGQELPGNYNSVFLTELFHEQSSRWPMIARQHVLQLHKESSAFIKRALAHEVKEDHVYQEIHKILNCSLRENLNAALAELQRLCDDERMQPITYNHYYTDNIQKSRQDATKTVIENALKGASDDWQGKFHVSNTLIDTSRLLCSMQGKVTVDMDLQACEEAKAGLEAYYKVDMKTFVDNVCRQVVERHLVRSLRHMFPPPMILSFSEEEIARIASEPSSKLDRRRELKVLEKTLQESLFELRM